MATRRLTIWAGHAMVAISALHTLVFLPHPYWADWFSGGLWNADSVDEEAFTYFWALPGSFVAVVIVLGLLVSRAGRRGESLPAYVGWGLGAWCLVCVLLVGPSGFMLGLIPAGLLIADDLRQRRRETGPQSESTPWSSTSG